MKLLIIVSLTIFGTLGGYIGALLDHGNWLGGWSILFTAVGSFFGIWAGYKVGQNFGV